MKTLGKVGMMRRRTHRCIRLFLLFSFVSFVAFQIGGIIVGQSINQGETIDEKRVLHKDESKASLEEAKKTTQILKSNETRPPLITTTPLSIESIEEIKQQIEVLNLEQTIRNEELFGPVNDKTIVIAIQVHNRVDYLRQLIQSLSKARGIERTLLIFSHDLWDNRINELVSSIDFAMSMQIFYPYSIQTHQSEFPGESPDDCPRNAKKAKAAHLQCTNKFWPDLYGHFREAKFTQTKHHWWWKANRIFDQLTATKNHNGLVLFLEEDHYVSEDFLHVLKMVNKERAVSRKESDIICLGTYLKNLNFPRNNKITAQRDLIGFMGGGIGIRPVAMRRGVRVPQSVEEDHQRKRRDTQSMANIRKPQSIEEDLILQDLQSESEEIGVFPTRKLQWGPAAIISSVFQSFSREFKLWPGGPAYNAGTLNVLSTVWSSAKHNMGMSFDRGVWRRVHACAEQFCAFDDYNWDWSLYHISQHCLEKKLQVLLVKAPRVFHVGECGVHHKKEDCDSFRVVKKVSDILAKAAKYLYPTDIQITPQAFRKKVKVPKGNGGWGDLRDQTLCKVMARPYQDGDDVLENTLNEVQEEHDRQ